MTMCMEAGPPLSDENGSGVDEGTKKSNDERCFYTGSVQVCTVQLSEVFFFFFSTVFFFFWAICLFSRPLKQGCVLPGQPPGSMARFLRWPRPHHRPIGGKKNSCCCFAGEWLK